MNFRFWLRSQATKSRKILKSKLKNALKTLVNGIFLQNAAGDSRQDGS